ncbi:MAG TPA: hypothetical protein VGG58_05240 [Candidatus Acidoferrum sp.]
MFTIFLRDAVTFVDDQTLAVSFLTRNEHPGMSRRDGAAGGFYLFHTAFLDPATGRVKAETWGNAGNWNTILGLDGGRIFVQDAEWVHVYSKELAEITAKRLTVHGDLLPRFLTSTSGKTLYAFQDGYDSRKGVVHEGGSVEPGDDGGERRSDDSDACGGDGLG